VSVAVHTTSVVRHQLHLTKINFEVSCREKTSMFVGREWLFRDIEVVSMMTEPCLLCAHKLVEMVARWSWLTAIGSL